MKNYHLTIALLLFFGLWMGNVHAQGKTDPIIKTSDPQGWIINTAASAYQVIVDKAGRVKPVFYGPAEKGKYGQKNPLWREMIEEVPVRGAFPNKSTQLEVVFNDQVRDADLQLVSGDITTVDGRPTLKITQKDRQYPLEVTSYIRVLPEYDILEKWMVVKNTGKKGNIKLEKALSGSILLPENQYELTHMAGTHAHEFMMRKTELTEGVKTLEARDFKSFNNPPWYLVRPKGEEETFSGNAWFGSLIYSGFFRLDFEKFFDGNVQVVGGINFWDSHWNLKPGASFETPKFVSGFTKDGSEGAAQRLRTYTRETVLPASHRDKLRPVLYNSWYATYFDVNEAQQLALAKEAKDLGVEMFVIDDGWFKGRKDNKAGLGDWTVDKEKFPNGLGPMIQKINDLGMDFGIWVEPEMVNPNSDLYRQHPDWVLNFPNRTRHQGRNQLMLNLANEEVYQNLLKQFSTLLKENNIKYIKWDHNRTLSDPGWPQAPTEQQREVRIRFISNLYRLIEQLRKQFPEVWFETCSGGGGRAELGMLSRMDVAWASDNTEPLDRLFIHYGYQNFLPANTMISWVTKPHRLTHQPLTLDFTFDVSMSGVLGVGTDITKWSAEEKALAKKKVEQYKRIRPLVQQGTLYRLASPYEGNRSILQYVGENSTSVVLCYNLAEYLKGNGLDAPQNVLQLKGLNPTQTYQIEKLGLPARNQIKETFTGDFLMNVGIDYPVRGANKSMILVVQPVK
ncbi:MAG: alpha-galactosidase [Rufibacter sp.]